MTRAGKFITIEGGEGVGKSTNIEFLTAQIEAAGHSVRCTREPGGTPVAERIRALLLEHGDEEIPDMAELLLFFAARALNIRNTIRPALEAGVWVICDRYTDASRAYQGGGRGLDRERIETLAYWIEDGLSPDLTILLDAPAEVGMGRAERRGEADRLESEQRSFYERVRAAYLALANAEPQRFRVVDASQDLPAVQAALRAALGELLD